LLPKPINRTQPVRASLPIVQKPNPTVSEASIQISTWPIVVNDYLVFDITNNKIVENTYPAYNGPEASPGGAGQPEGGYGRGPGPDQNRSIVNMLFVKNDGSITRTLFKENCLILSRRMASYRIPGPNQLQNVLPKNIYLVVTTDTNGNGRLDMNDSKVLFVSDYDGTDLTKVMESIENYFPIDSNRLLILQKNQQETQYYTYDLVAGSLTPLINTKDLGYK
jgi:hypothetical protein